MRRQFHSFVGVDWSGRGAPEDSNPGLAVAEASGPTATVLKWHARKRSRIELVSWLASRLGPSEHAVCIGLDFAFGFPMGAMKSVFGASEWRELPDRMRALLTDYGTAKSVAVAINADARFRGNGPFRTNEDRTNSRFYLDSGIPYYRLVEQFVPQAISQWYMGSGATVAFSTITGLAALGDLLARRDRLEIDFTVHPFEPQRLGVHTLVEVYPAIWQKESGSPANEHERDALRTAIGLRNLGEKALTIPALPSGNGGEAVYAREEGWIAGVS